MCCVGNGERLRDGTVAGSGTRKRWVHVVEGLVCSAEGPEGLNDRFALYVEETDRLLNLAGLSS